MIIPASSISTEASASSRIGRAFRSTIGIFFTLILMSIVNDYGLEMGGEGAGWLAAVLASSALLLLLCWKNVPALWTYVGRLLRWALGERAARIAFAVVAVTFALSGFYGFMSTTYAPGGPSAVQSAVVSK